MASFPRFATGITTVVFVGTLCLQSAYAQYAGGMPSGSYFLFSLTIEGFVRCESQHAELAGSAEKFTESVQARAPGMFDENAIAEIKSKIRGRIHQDTQQKPVTLAECKKFIADDSAIQRIAQLYQEDAAKATNKANK